MPRPLYQCTETESYPGGGGYTGNEPVHDTYYTYDPAGVLVTVTRVGGSSWTAAGGLHDGRHHQYQPVLLWSDTRGGGGGLYPGSGTLVFDDFEMSKTIVDPTHQPGDTTLTNDPYSNPWPFDWVDKDFNVVLSNPRLDPFESTNVSPPRLDTPFSTARVRIVSGAGLGSDPNQNSGRSILRQLLRRCV